MAQADDKNSFSPLRISVSLNVVELNSKDLFGLSGPVWPWWDPQVRSQLLLHEVLAGLLLLLPPPFLGGSPVVQVASTNGMLSQFELPLEIVLFDDKNLLESECMGRHYACSRIPLARFLSHLSCGHNALGKSTT